VLAQLRQIEKEVLGRPQMSAVSLWLAARMISSSLQ